MKVYDHGGVEICMAIVLVSCGGCQVRVFRFV